jgi:serine protease
VLRALACSLLIALPVTAEEFVAGRVLVRVRGDRARLQRVPDTRAALAELRARAEVAWAEPDRVRRRATAVTPDDEMYFEQWALPLIHAPEAWARTTGSERVVVAVLDTGIRYHPDLQARLVPGWDFVSDPDSGNDGDGRDPDPTDTGALDASSSMIHGTHVAGIVGALSDNRMGVAGLDWHCRVQPIRVLGVKEGQGVDSDIADAIRWAAGLHVDGVPDNATPADVSQHELRRARAVARAAGGGRRRDRARRGVGSRRG